jgi:hypothetical protein
MWLSGTLSKTGGGAVENPNALKRQDLQPTDKFHNSLRDDGLAVVSLAMKLGLFGHASSASPA